jgi:cytochrome oxidase assembly protein ShyY1
MVFALIATAGLGVWQYSVAHRNDISQQVLQASATTFDSVSKLGEYVAEQNYGRLVTFEGEIDCGNYLLVTLDSKKSPWLVCPLKFSDGTRVAVVIGEYQLTKFQDSSSPMKVSVTGRIQPAQDTSQLSPIYKTDDEASVEYLNTDDLVIRWKSDVRDGYVVMTAIDADSDIAHLESLTRISDEALVLPPVGIEIRNLFYAWQWWIFAAFAIFIWFRFVRDEIREARSVTSN